MAIRVVFFLLTCFLVINNKVSSDQWDQAMLIDGAAFAPAQSPIYGGSPTPAPAPTPTPPQAAPAPSPVGLAPPLPPPPPPAAPAPSPVVEPPPSAPPARQPRNRFECIPLCVVRCRYHLRIITCMRDCLTCCETCKCVPYGQYGNREQCGTCYTDMTKRNGKPRCP